MNVLDGSKIGASVQRTCDFAIDGSGPAGATVAKHLADSGANVIVVEAGARHSPESFPSDSWAAMSQLYRDMGTSLTRNLPPLPFVQGCAAAVRGVTDSDYPIRVEAEHGVVLAACAVQSPALIQRSGIDGGPIGEHFSAHPGVSVSGRFPERAGVWHGATQGHEVIGMRAEGIKFEALGYDMAMAAARLKGVGQTLADGLDELAYQAHWGAAVRATSEGTVTPSSRDGVRVGYAMRRADMEKIRRGVATLCRLMLAAGAERAYPGIVGWPNEVDSQEAVDRLEAEAPLDASKYRSVITHMFGTCRMGTDPEHAVVAPDCQHHHVARLFVADSSVFPTNTGVNPQTSIMTLAGICAELMVNDQP